MKQVLLLLTISLLLIGGKSYGQLMQHGDSELNQLNLIVKYVNESRNVLQLLHSEVKNDSTQIAENFEASLYHMSSLTLLDRQTCLLMEAGIKSNSRHFDAPPFTTLMDQFATLRTHENNLETYVVETSNKMKQIENLSMEDLDKFSKEIQAAHSVILKSLNEIDFKENQCGPCGGSIEIYDKVAKLFDSENFDSSKAQAEKINTEIEKMDLATWSDFSYPKELLDAAHLKTKELLEEIQTEGVNSTNRNKLLSKYYYQPDGLSQLFNEAFEKFKNQNKEVKYINRAAVPIKI